MNLFISIGDLVISRNDYTQEIGRTEKKSKQRHFRAVPIRISQDWIYAGGNFSGGNSQMENKSDSPLPLSDSSQRR